MPNAWAEGASSLRNLKVVVPDARGKPGTGGPAITKSVRRTVSEAIGPLIPSKNLTGAQKKLKHKGKKLSDPQALAEAARRIDAQYVLSIEITKEKWVYTAHAMLINAENGKVQMDFRSQYFKPNKEADDRGKRIGARTIQKLEQLDKEGPPPAIAGAATNARAKPDAREPPSVAAGTGSRLSPGDSGKLPAGDEPDDLKSEPRSSSRPESSAPPSATGGISISGRSEIGAGAPPLSAGSGSGTRATVGITPVAVEEAAEIFRFTVAGGAGLLHTYDLASSTIGNSRLSYRLDPLALLTATAEMVAPGIPIGLSIRGAYRPVRFKVTTDSPPAPQAMGPRGTDARVTNPVGMFLDASVLLEGHIAIAGSGRQTFKLIPGAGIKLGRVSVDPHPGNVILSSTALAPVGALTLRMPINEVLEIGIGVGAGPIISFKESPSCSGRAVDTTACNGAKNGLTIGGDLNARIWLSSAVGIAFDTRFDYDRVKFDGTATRQPPPNEPLDNVTTVTKDLRSSIGIAFRL